MPRLPIGTALAGAVAEDGRPRRTEIGHQDASTSLGGAAMAAPLQAGHVDGRRPAGRARPERARVHDEDEETLVSLAGPAGIAVDNVLLHREAQRLSVTDPLTGAGNLRHMTTTLAREVERATRFERPLALLLLDLDHFKRVNDTFGHTVGDAVLRELARRLQECVREVDTVARYGGEEFVIICPETDAEGAASLADRVCGDRPRGRLHRRRGRRAGDGLGRRRLAADERHRQRRPGPLGRRGAVRREARRPRPLAQRERPARDPLTALEPAPGEPGHPAR